MPIDLVRELKAQRTKRHLPPNYIGDLCGRAAVEIECLRAGGWIVGDGSGKHWRTWQNGMPKWTSDRDLALQYNRRQDAEAAHLDDDDAWVIEQFNKSILEADT